MKHATAHRPGYTLIEVMAALFVFTIISVAVTRTFSYAFFSYTVARATERDMESLQLTMNTLNKVFRASTVLSSTTTSIKLRDYSQAKCLQYKIDSAGLEWQEGKTAPSDPTPTNPTGCESVGWPSEWQSLGEKLTGSFKVTPSVAPAGSTPATVGRITTVLKVQGGDARSHFMSPVQSTVSLRDYPITEINN